MLWRKWPEIYWTESREGISMKFIHPPTPGLVPNQELKGVSLEVAIQFTDDLISLGVLRKATPLDQVVSKFPLFMITKPSQQQNIRTIADGRTEG